MGVNLSKNLKNDYGMFLHICGLYGIRVTPYLSWNFWENKNRGSCVKAWKWHFLIILKRHICVWIFWDPRAWTSSRLSIEQLLQKVQDPILSLAMKRIEKGFK